MPKGASFSIECGCRFRRRPEYKVRRQRQTVRVRCVGRCLAHSEPGMYALLELVATDRMMNVTQVEIDPLAVELDSRFA